MATLSIPVRAEPTVALPVLLIARYLEKGGLLDAVQLVRGQTSSKGGDDEAGGRSIRVSATSGDVSLERDVIAHFTAILNDKIGRQTPLAAPVTEWVKRSQTFASKAFTDLRKPLDELASHLTLRTYIVGYHLTIADLAVWATLRGNRVALGALGKQPSLGNVSRWYHHIDATNPWIGAAVNELLAQSDQERARARAAASAAGASYEINFPDIHGPIVTRFPPEPSGYLHIGHVKAAVLNDYFAHKLPGGTLICRFDDTNPSNESIEFQDAILEDLRSIDILPDKISYSSDYFQVMYGYALRMIKEGKAFADDSQLGKGDQDRKNRLPSKRRDLSIEETLSRFEEMSTGSEEGQRWCLRARIQYDSLNGALRDPVIYRCNLTPHHRTGTEWKVYPTYDFCAPILDSIEGVNLALRTNEYRDRNAQYACVQAALGLRAVSIWDFSRINFVRTVLSKRKLTRVVAAGRVRGWDDPRMPTVRGILRRGVAVAALRDFILRQGPSRNVVNLEWGALWAANKRHVDPVAARYTAVADERAVRCRVLGVDGPGELAVARHAKNAGLGRKRVVTSGDVVIEQVDAQALVEGEEITLMNWGNAFVRRIISVQDADGRTGGARTSVVQEVELELHLGGDAKKTAKKITWLAALPGNMIPVDLVSFDHLITKDKLAKDDELENCLTPVTEFRVAALADCNVRELAQGSVLQFDRKGFFKVDVPYQGQDSRMVCFEIPTGKL